MGLYAIPDSFDRHYVIKRLPLLSLEEHLMFYVLYNMLIKRVYAFFNCL